MQLHAGGGVAVYKDLLKASATLPDLDLVLVHDLADKIARSEPHFEAAREIMTGWCAEKARADARNAQDARAPFHAWEKMSQLFLQAEIYNLDKRQAVINAFLLLQNPNMPGLNV